MKTKRKTTKKPAMLHKGARGKLAEVAKHALGLELRLDNMQTSVNGRMDRLEDAFNSVWNQHRERIAKLEGHAANVSAASKALGIPESEVAWSYGKVTTTPSLPEPVIPEGWKRTTKEEAFQGKDDFYYGLWRPKAREIGDDAWSGPEKLFGDQEDKCDYTFLARKLPELPEALAAWQACDEAEAWPMGRTPAGVELFAVYHSECIAHRPVFYSKPFAKGAIPIKPRVQR